MMRPSMVTPFHQPGFVSCVQSNDGEERLAVVRLLAKLFGAKDSELASQNRPLWQCFLGR